MKLFYRFDLRKKIDDLKMIIDVAEENYKTALQSKLDFTTLREMRGNLRRLKNDLQVLLDQESVNETVELPDEDSQKNEVLFG